MPPTHRRHQDRGGRVELGLIGAGAFGAFAVPHLRPFFDVAVHDPRPDLDRLCAGWGVASAGLAEAAARRVVVLAVPLAALRDAARAIAPHLRPGALVVDVCSVKVRPLAILREELPAGTAIVGTHPLFGPSSGRTGIAGLNVVLCRDGGRGEGAVERFLRGALKLDVTVASPEQHDRQMACVQALSHLVARSLKGLDVPPPKLRTAGFGRLAELLEMLGDDSDALFATIVGGNPYAPAMLNRFLDEARSLVDRVTCGAGG